MNEHAQKFAFKVSSFHGNGLAAVANNFLQHFKTQPTRSNAAIRACFKKEPNLYALISVQPRGTIRGLPQDALGIQIWHEGRHQQFDIVMGMKIRREDYVPPIVIKVKHVQQNYKHLYAFTAGSEADLARARENQAALAIINAFEKAGLKHIFSDSPSVTDMIELAAKAIPVKKLPLPKRRKD